jgi:hypothetical protein
MAVAYQSAMMLAFDYQRVGTTMAEPTFLAQRLTLK